MRQALLLAAAVATLAGATPARGLAAGCPPAGPVLSALRAAGRVQIEQLGSDEQRVDTPLAHVPGRTLGYEVLGVFRVGGTIANRLRDAFGRSDSYACAPDAPVARFDTPRGLPIGLWFGTGERAVAVVLHLPEGRVEMQIEGEPRVSAPLSRAGQLRWEMALAVLARETRTSAADFYRQMTPSDRAPVETPAPPDTASSP